MHESHILSHCSILSVPTIKKNSFCSVQPVTVCVHLQKKVLKHFLCAQTCSRNFFVFGRCMRVCMLCSERQGVLNIAFLGRQRNTKREREREHCLLGPMPPPHGRGRGGDAYRDRYRERGEACFIKIKPVED